MESRPDVAVPLWSKSSGCSARHLVMHHSEILIWLLTLAVASLIGTGGFCSTTSAGLRPWASSWRGGHGRCWQSGTTPSLTSCFPLTVTVSISLRHFNTPRLLDPVIVIKRRPTLYQISIPYRVKRVFQQVLNQLHHTTTLNQILFWGVIPSKAKHQQHQATNGHCWPPTMDYYLDQSGLSCEEAVDMNMDDFFNWDEYIGSSDTALLNHEQPAHETEATGPSQRSYCDSTQDGSGSRYSQSSYSTPSDHTCKEVGVLNFAIDTDADIFLSHPILSSLDDDSLDYGALGIDPNVFPEYSLSVSPTMGAIPVETSSGESSPRASGTSIHAPLPASESRSLSASSASPRQRKRRNAKDLKKNQRKANKPEKCPVCNKGSGWNRDLKRHLVAKHTDFAAEMGLDVSKTKCPKCIHEVWTIRPDLLKRHVERIHG
jgi:hypothetical protein